MRAMKNGLIEKDSHPLPFGRIYSPGVPRVCPHKPKCVFHDFLSKKTANGSSVRTQLLLTSFRGAFSGSLKRFGFLVLSNFFETFGFWGL